MKNEWIKQKQVEAELARNSAELESVYTLVDLYIMLCEIARRLPPPLDDTE